ncbi:MAG: adenylate/guanylate cyclase domain-containing protein, partial [Burkholderiales bacterium]
MPSGAGTTLGPAAHAVSVNATANGKDFIAAMVHCRRVVWQGFEARLRSVHGERVSSRTRALDRRPLAASALAATLLPAGVQIMAFELSERRLAAIVIADVVGYTRLMERDETGTHARLREIRARVIEPSIAENGGHTVRTAGDGMLVQFSSAAAALRCSVDVQRAMQARNRSMPPGDRIDFRIGINLGDIIVDGDDIAGDGVNVASRLETIAEPGGICVSAAVREQVHGGIDVQFVDIGEQSVKNIARPIRTYRVGLSAASLRRCWPWLRLGPGSRWRQPAGVAMAFAIGAVGLVSLNRQFSTATDLAGPPFMSVAILPFAPQNPLDKPSADRLTRSVTTAMQRSVRPARVVSNGLAVNYTEDGPRDPRRAGTDLNVRYLVEGDLDTSKAVTEFDVRLIDAANGIQLWSDRLSVTPAAEEYDLELVARLSDHLGTAIARAESIRIARLPKSTSEAIDRVLRAVALWHQNPSLEGTLAARALYAEALGLDPHSAPALVGMGYTLHMQLVDDPNADREKLIGEMDDISRRAVRADPHDPMAWLLRGNALALQGRRDEALEANAAAMRIDPYLCAALQDQAGLYTAMGKPENALPLLEKARVVSSPGHSMQVTSLYTCRAQLALGNYGDAVRSCEKAGALGLDWWYLHLLLSAAYAQSGDIVKAEAAKARLLQQRPDMSLQR